MPIDLNSLLPESLIVMNTNSALSSINAFTALQLSILSKRAASYVKIERDAKRL
jgi:hypothetical protein